MSKRILLSVSMLLMLAGCSSIPESIQSNNSELVTSFDQLEALESGNEVRLGGVITRATNEADYTEIEVVNLPISESSGKPNINAEPSGRYIVRIDRFVEPMQLTQGRPITVLGQLEGREFGTVGDFEYQYPVIKASGFQLWRIEQSITSQGSSFGVGFCRGGFCSSVNSFPTDAKVKQRVVE